MGAKGLKMSVLKNFDSQEQRMKEFYAYNKEIIENMITYVMKNADQCYQDDFPINHIEDWIIFLKIKRIER